MRQRRLKLLRRFCLTSGLPDPFLLVRRTKSDDGTRRDPDAIWRRIGPVRRRIRKGRASAHDFVRIAYDLVRRRGFSYDSLREQVQHISKTLRSAKTDSERKDAIWEFCVSLAESRISSEDAEAYLLKPLREANPEILENVDFRNALALATEGGRNYRRPRIARTRGSVKAELSEVCRLNPGFERYRRAIERIIDHAPRKMRVDNRKSTMLKCALCTKNWRPRLRNIAADTDPAVRDGLLWEVIHNLRHTPKVSVMKDRKGDEPSDETKQTLHGSFVGLRDHMRMSTALDRVSLVESVRKILEAHDISTVESDKILDILWPGREGRARQCRSCLIALNRAKTKEDYLKIREEKRKSSPSGGRAAGLETWLDRCVKAIRGALFYTDPAGHFRCRYPGVRTIAMEIPRYQPEEMSDSKQARKKREKKAKEILERQRFNQNWPHLRKRFIEQGGVYARGLKTVKKKAVCIYCGISQWQLLEDSTAPPRERYKLPPGFEEDHVFPRDEKHAGQRLAINEVVSCVSCNRSGPESKHNQTPHEWFGDDAARWSQFCKRVASSDLPSITKNLLLSKETVFPHADSLLSRSSAARKPLTR